MGAGRAEREIELFEGLGRDVVSEAIGLAKRTVVERGHVFFRQGARSLSVYLIDQGRVRMEWLTARGASSSLTLLGPGRLFGCDALARIRQRSFSVTADTDTTVLVWDAPTLVRLFEEHPPLGLNYLAIAIRCYLDCMQRLVERTSDPLPQRLARCLLRLAADFGRQKKTGLVIDMRLTRQDLGDIIGATLYTVSRLLSAWQREGLIASRPNRRLAILDESRLQYLAEE